MARRGFHAAHLAFERKLDRLGLAVFRESAQDLARVANTPIAQGGRMPVDTSNLRNSFVASKSGVPGSGGSALELVLLDVRLGDSVWMGWTAAYALRMEYGFYGADSLGRVYSQGGYGFMRAAALQWPQIVDRAVSRVALRAAGKQQ